MLLTPVAYVNQCNGQFVLKRELDQSNFPEFWDELVLKTAADAHVTRLQAEVEQQKIISKAYIASDGAKDLRIVAIERERDALKTEVERLKEGKALVEIAASQVVKAKEALQSELTKLADDYCKRVDELTKALSEAQRYKTMSDNYCALGMDANIELTKAREVIAELEGRVILKDAGIDFRDALINEAYEIAYRELPDAWMSKARTRLAHQSAPDCKHEWIDDGMFTLACVKCGKVVEQHQSAPAAKCDTACTSCDGSGEYIDALGDWRGYCKCPAGIAAKGEE